MSNTAVDSPKLPPMLLQYVEYKGRYPDCILLFQVGDFYELFFEDAVTASKALNLTLTTRDKNNPNPIPMCGVPIGVIDGYLERLTAMNYSVAIVSQTEAVQGGKGPVGRALERIVTPGVRILSHASGEVGGSVVASVAIETDQDCAVAYSDVQSGRILVREGLSRTQLVEELRRIGPEEIVLPSVVQGQKIDKRLLWVRDLQQSFSHLSLKFRVDRTGDPSFGDARELSKITGFSVLPSLSKRAIRILTDYIDEVTIGATVPITEISRASDEGVLSIDAMTRANLELVRNTRDGGRDGSLLHQLDATCSISGARLLREWVLNPRTDIVVIEQRLNAVEALLRSHQRQEIRTMLGRIADGERIAVRLDLGVAGPRELVAVREMLAQIPKVRESVERLCTGSAAQLDLLSQIHTSLRELPEVAATLEQALVDQPPQHLNDGGVFAPGYDAELDRLRGIRTEGTSWVQELEARERARTGISSLKIKFNNVFGYFIEITNSNLARVPEDYTRRQTTANGERYVTPELKLRETEIVGAQDKAILLEKKLFDQLRRDLQTQSDSLRANARALAMLDVLCSLAEIAEREGYTRPVIEDSERMIIVEGRHPVLAPLLRGDFVANSLTFGSLDSADDGPKCMVITGPNMGGKSTFLRQTALIALLAQIGSFVPAREAHIGIVDRIFARIGASDNLREGESTFMVEMREASSIVAHATNRSLVLIDEIGRGTATLDGLSLAQAILEWMVVKVRSRILFATHFHELTVLDSIYPSVMNLSVGSEERGSNILFTHQICAGAANRSYGLEVAELAGLPKGLMKRARELLRGLSAHEDRERNATPQLSLFQESSSEDAVEEEQPARDELRARIAGLDVDSMTPREALQFLFDIREDILRG